MACRRHRVARVVLVSLLFVVGVLGLVTLSTRASAFGDGGVFHPRFLLVGETSLDARRATAASRLSWELTRRTNASARLVPTPVRADSKMIAHEPFAWWIGDDDVGVLTMREVDGLRMFFALGGVLFVDDSDPASGRFGMSARRELARVIPDTTPIPIGTEHVLYRSFYLLSRPEGRAQGPERLEAIVRHGQAQVVFSSHDVAGALARNRNGQPHFAVTPGGDRQREMAVRLAVNVAMFVLCSDYKDDQVHAPALMRRRLRGG